MNSTKASKTNNRPLISVIIPIYCAEKWLCKCVESVLNQTYTNLEIILIDDGSPDQCARICDEYAKSDDRIIVVHKQNAGVSNARNSGLDICSGDFISFVDSDDWIEKDTYESFIKVYQLHPNVDVFQFNILWRNESNDAIESSFNEPQKEELLGSYQALCKMLQSEVVNGFVWTKIYRSDCVRNVRFIEKIFSEDMIFNYSVFTNIEYVFCYPLKKYNYRFCTSSLSHGKIKDECFNTLCCLEKQKKQVVDKTLYNLWTYYQLDNAFWLYNRMLITQTYDEKKDFVRGYIRDCYKELKEKKMLTWKQRIMINTCSFNSKLYEKAYLTLVNMHNKR